MTEIRKLLWGLMFISLIAFSILFGPGTWTKFQASQQADNFLQQVEKEEFEKAFDKIYYFDRAFDEDVTITRETAKERWLDRNVKLRTAGTYIKSHDEISIRLNDSWPLGEVNLVMMENGMERLYNDVQIHFNKTDGKWKIAGLYTGEELSWTSKIGGHVAE